ncbi:MAG: hypothetical protein IPH03_00290 [Tetrasphaera sp.]|nr:hypothetical protein [Tetrasphaera sp.]
MSAQTEAAEGPAGQLAEEVAEQVATFDATPAADVPTVLAACHARLLEREGIAMVVAVDDLRPGRTMPAVDEDDRRQGLRLAGLFDHYYRGLADVGFPPQFPDEPDETGSRELIDTLVVLADQHLRARIETQVAGAEA